MLNLDERLSMEERVINLLIFAAKNGFNIRKISINKDDYRQLCENINNAINTDYCIILAPVGNCIIEKDK